MLRDNRWLRDADESENDEISLSQSAQDTKTAKKAQRNSRGFDAKRRQTMACPERYTWA